MIKSKIKSFFSDNFVFKGKEKLSKLTILFILTLDIFIFITLGLGIDFQIKVLNNPHVIFPSQCRTIINSKDMDSLDKYYYSSKGYYSKYQSIMDDQMDSRCKILLDEKLKNVKKEHNIEDLKSKDAELHISLSEVSKELDYLRENYNTVLFEKMSEQSNEKSIVKDDINSQNIKNKYDKYLKQTKDLKKQQEDLYKSFKESNSVKVFTSYSKENREAINKEYKEQTKSYEIKRELVTIAFLLPLLFIAFYLMKKYLLSEKYVLYLMFKNIFVVIFIPLFITFISLIVLLIPKVFIEKIVRFFYELEIPFLVYYFMIALFVVLFGYLIVKIQKRYKENIEKLKNNNITKVESYNRNICNQCGNSINYNTMNFCPCCKNSLKTKCTSCGKDTIEGLSFCCNCGEELN